jgi:hypothetical protein
MNTIRLFLFFFIGSLGINAVAQQNVVHGNSARTYGYNLANSVVWNTAPRFNALVETVFISKRVGNDAGKNAVGKPVACQPGDPVDV